MADNKVENAEVAEEVCTKEKPVEKEKKVEEVVEDEKEEKEADEKAENGDAKEENGKEVEAEDDKKEESEVTVCKRKSTAGDAANGVEGTPEKKQKLEDAQAEDNETTEVAA